MYLDFAFNFSLVNFSILLVDMYSVHLFLLLLLLSNLLVDSVVFLQVFPTEPTLLGLRLIQHAFLVLLSLLELILLHLKLYLLLKVQWLTSL